MAMTISTRNTNILSRTTTFKMCEAVPGVLDTSRGLSVRIQSDIGIDRYKAIGPILNAWRRAVICDMKETRLYVVRKPMIGGGSGESSRRRVIVCGRSGRRVAVLKRVEREGEGEGFVEVWRGGGLWLVCEGRGEWEFGVRDVESGRVLVWRWCEEGMGVGWGEEKGFYHEIGEGCDAALMLAVVLGVDDLFRKGVRERMNR